MRASEALSIRLADCDVNANPPKLLIRGEYCKNKGIAISFLNSGISSATLAMVGI